MKICVLIATHKPYSMPADDVYLPIEVGRALHQARTPFQGDDTGDNISARNATYCELTALYWAWKNLKRYDFIGLVHYRRHFVRREIGLLCCHHSIYTRTDFVKSLERAPVLLPTRRHYVIETNAAQYGHAHHARDLTLLREVIAVRDPKSLAAFDTHMRERSTHICNMFVMRCDIFDAYCRWLFDILFALEPRLDLSDYSTYDRRVFGFLAERLLDVYLMSREISYTEAPVTCLESQHWGRKIAHFLWRKWRGGTVACRKKN